MRIAEFTSTITFRLPAEHELGIALLAENQGVSVSHLLREAVEVILSADAHERENS